MTIYDLYPSFVQIHYHGPQFNHISTVPTRQWNPLGGTRGGGGYTAWDSSNRDALDMIDDLTDDMALLLPTTAGIDSAIIWNYPSLGAPAVPVYGYTLTTPGNDASPGWDAATEFIYTFYDSAFNTAKLVVLEAASNGSFAQSNPAGFSSDEAQLPGGFIVDTNAWASRAGFQPSTIRHLTRGLNKRLRRKYLRG